MGGSFGPHALDFIKDIGHRITESTGEKKSTSYLMQTIGMAIQRGNSSCILETVSDSNKLMGCTTSNSNFMFTDELFRIISLFNFNVYPTVIFSLINPK